MWMDVDAALTAVPVNVLPLIDDTDFKSRETAIAYNESGMDLVWNFVTTAGVFSQTAVTPTTGGDYDWAHQGDGMYTIEIPASGGASINNDTEGFGWFTGLCDGVLPWRGPIIGFRAAGLNNLMIDSAYSATRGLSGTALPDANADAAGGLPVSDLGGLDLDTLLGYLTGSVALASVCTEARLAELDAANIPANVDTLLTRIVGTLAAGTHNAQSGDAYSRLGAPIAASISADIAVVDGIVDTIVSRIVGTLAAGTHNAQSGDSYTRLGAPAGASVSADIALLATAAKLLAYVQLITRSDAAIETDNATELTEINADGGSGAGNYSAQTDSLEENRDNIGTTGANLSVAVGAGGIVAASYAANAREAAGQAADVGTENATAVWASGTRTLTSAAGFQVKKNTQLANFMFVMTDSTNHNPSTGLTVTATRSIDGAAFGACANAVTEVSGGWYKITLAAADLNGDTIALRFTAAASDDLNISLVTQS